MKTNVLKTLLIFLIVGLVSTSCKKDEDSTETTSNTSSGNAIYVVKLKKDDNPEITYTEGAAMLMGDKIIIGANNSDSDIQFSINPDITTGSYTDGYLISHGVNNVAIFSTATNVQSSTLEITTHDKVSKHIVGSFSVNYTDNNDSQISHTATGSLDITYQ